MTRYTRIIPPPVLTWQAAASVRVVSSVFYTPEPRVSQASELVNWEDEGGSLEIPGLTAPSSDHGRKELAAALSDSV